MALYTVKRGLDLPLEGAPEQRIGPAPEVRRVALVALDYIGIRPTMLCAVGDAVRRGEPLFEDKKAPGVRYASPAAGTVVAINRGDRRALNSVVVELTPRERAGEPTPDDDMPFASYTGKDPAGMSADEVRALLLESGLWTALRTRPFSKVPDPGTRPHSIFVTAMDTNPLAADPDVVIAGREEAFEKGVQCLVKLTDGIVYLCRRPNSKVPALPNSGAQLEEFAGCHPAGAVGFHIHMLDAVHREKVVWHAGYQDVAAIGELVMTGRLPVRRVVALGGPAVAKPRLLATRLGASTDDLVKGQLKTGPEDPVRVISGSVLSGRAATGEAAGYLGRYHQQVTVLREGRHREFLGWMVPGRDKFSVTNSFLSALSRNRLFDLDTNLNGSRRAMVPIGLYEKVMPMDIMPTFLLRALVMGDVEQAEQLGCLELDEEDLALCTFVCPGKYDYGVHLRTMLDLIEKEG